MLLIDALARIWSKIRELHPRVPGVVLLAAPAARETVNALGYFAALRWSAKKKGGSHLHEVAVVAEHLNRPVEEIVETLLHEAAHAMNFELGIKDCSASQYHNQRFRDAALRLGLEVTQVRHYGYALTKMPPETAAIYKEEIESLTQVLVHRRRMTPFGTGPTPKGGEEGDDSNDNDNRPRSRNLKAVCACGFIIRVSKATLENTVIRCESCGKPFYVG
ncbi:MAG: hypothetical protein WC526_00770 [Patescibacteria group bacterium]